MAPREYVADTGFLRHPDIRALFSKQRSRIAIAPVTQEECSSGNAVTNLSKSLAIISQYPDQVLILRGPEDLADVARNNKQVDRADLIDKVATEQFSGFCQDVAQAANGSQQCIRWAKSYEVSSNSRMSDFRQRAPNFVKGTMMLASGISDDRLLRIRKGNFGDHATDARWLYEHTRLLTRSMVTSQNKPIPNGVDATSCYELRYALASLLLSVWWIEHGGITSASINKIANDVKDASISVYATYFDGLLTTDGKLRALHGQLREALTDLFATPPGIGTKKK